MNRKNFIIRTTGLASVFTGNVFLAHAATDTKKHITKKQVIREGHRGFCHLFPENTTLAFEEAIKAGVDRIETDLRLSSDGKMVLIHDETVDRTTNSKGKVADLTFSELRKLDAGSWMSPKFKGLKIPTLEEVFKIAKGNCFVNIDLKDAKAAVAMVKLAEKTDMVDQIVITGKIPECVDEIRRANNSVTMFYELQNDFVLQHPKQAVKNIRQKQLPGSLIHFEAANETFIRESKLHGLTVSAWGVLEEEDMKNLIEMGVDSIMTDNLTLLNKMLS